MKVISTMPASLNLIVTKIPSISNVSGPINIMYNPLVRLQIGRTIIVLLLVAVTTAIAGCSPEHTRDNGQAAVKAARQFVIEYDRWAQNAYKGDLPRALRNVSTGIAQDKLISDGNWYRNAGVKQLGQVEIINLKTIKQSNEATTIEMRLDATNVRFRSAVAPTRSPKNKKRSLEFSMIRDGMWKVQRIIVLDDIPVE